MLEKLVKNIGKVRLLAGVLSLTGCGPSYMVRPYTGAPGQNRSVAAQNLRELGIINVDGERMGMRCFDNNGRMEFKIFNCEMVRGVEYGNRGYEGSLATRHIYVDLTTGETCARECQTSAMSWGAGGTCDRAEETVRALKEYCPNIR